MPRERFRCSPGRSWRAGPPVSRCTRGPRQAFPASVFLPPGPRGARRSLRAAEGGTHCFPLVPSNCVGRLVKVSKWFDLDLHEGGSEFGGPITSGGVPVPRPRGICVAAMGPSVDAGKTLL